MDNYGYANSEDKQFCELLADGCLLLLLQFTTAAGRIYVHNAYCILQSHQQELPVPPSPSQFSMQLHLMRIGTLKSTIMHNSA
jgi:hypothetical protein